MSALGRVHGSIGVAAATVVIGAMFALIRFSGNAPSAPPAQTPPSTGSSSKSSTIDETASVAVASSPSSIRDITPEGITRAYLAPSAVSARQRPKTSIHIERATLKSNATVSGIGGNVRLYGIAFPAAHEVCNSANGDRWPCGRRVFISFFNKANSEILDCEPRAESNPPAADCFVGDVHIVKWMLSEGLGRLTADVTDNELRAAEANAKKSMVGIWSDVRISSAAAPATQR